MDWTNYFEYNNGELFWKISVNQKIKIGDKAGDYCKGYRRLRLKKRQYMVHRIIYELLVGSIPSGYQIDHINGIKDDNRIENLRLATNTENGRNRGVTKNSSTGVKGVFWQDDKKKYRARIKVDGVKKHLGYFEKIEDAAKAYKYAAILYFGEFAKF